MRVIVIGAGASGLAAAVAAAEHGAKVTMLESAARPGRKLLAAGNGRCNVMNTGAPAYFGGRDFAETLFASRPGAVQRFLEHTGILLAEEEAGRVYPACAQSQAVLEALMNAVRRCGARVLYGHTVTEIRRTDNGFDVFSGEERFTAERVICCCGGMAGINLGHDGSSYRLMTEMGHALVPPRPALCGIETDQRDVSGLSGLRCPAGLTLCLGEKALDAAVGEALFARDGISGVCAMQLARKAGEYAGRELMLYVDFAPMLFADLRQYRHFVPSEHHLSVSTERVRALLSERRARFGEDLLVGLLPALLRERLKNVPLGRLAEQLTAFPLRVKGTRSFDHAQVTAGGLRTDAFDPFTMESKSVPGLYACGEMLDVDGDCGGFNLQFAFLSGLAAGENAARP